MWYNTIKPGVRLNTRDSVSGDDWPLRSGSLQRARIRLRSAARLAPFKELYACKHRGNHLFNYCIGICKCKRLENFLVSGKQGYAWKPAPINPGVEGRQLNTQRKPRKVLSCELTTNLR